MSLADGLDGELEIPDSPLTLGMAIHCSAHTAGISPHTRACRSSAYPSAKQRPRQEDEEQRQEQDDPPGKEDRQDEGDEEDGPIVTFHLQGKGP